MDSTQKLIVALLVLAILFSLFSIFISLSVTEIDLPQRGVSAQVTASGGGSGGLGLVVEGNNVPGGEG